MRDYLRAYREGITIGPLMDTTLKIYKSHRQVREDNTLLKYFCISNFCTLPLFQYVLQCIFCIYCKDVVQQIL